MWYPSHLQDIIKLSAPDAWIWISSELISILMQDLSFFNFKWFLDQVWMDGFLGYLEVGLPFGHQKYPQCGQLNIKSTWHVSYKWAMTKFLKKGDVLLSFPKVLRVTNKPKEFSKKVQS